MKGVFASVMLADHAQEVGGKLYICGGGWIITGPDPVPSAIALDLKVPWSEMNRKFRFRLELVDGDGQPFEVDTPNGKQPLALDGDFQMTPGPEQKPGSQLVGLAAINLPPQPYEPGEQYVWKLSINGEAREEWNTSFSVRPRPTQRQHQATG